MWMWVEKRERREEKGETQNGLFRSSSPPSPCLCNDSQAEYITATWARALPTMMLAIWLQLLLGELAFRQYITGACERFNRYWIIRRIRLNLTACSCCSISFTGDHPGVRRLCTPFPSTSSASGAPPYRFIGLFMGLGTSFLTLIVAETVGVKSGLGWYVSWAQGWAEYGKVYAALVIMAAFFSTIMTMLFKVRDRVLVWQKGVIKW